MALGGVEVVHEDVAHERAVAHVGGLLVVDQVAGEGEDDLGAVRIVVVRVDVLILVHDAVGSVFAVKDFLSEILALAETGGAGENLGVEQDTHLEHAVESLVHPVDRATYRECGESLIELALHPVANLLATLLEGCACTGALGKDACVGAGGKRDDTAEYLEHIVVAVQK